MKKKRYLITIIIAILLLTMGYGITYRFSANDISEEDFEDYILYEEQFLDIEVNFLNERGYINSDDIPILFDEIESAIQNGIKQGIIRDYTSTTKIKFLIH